MNEEQRAVLAAIGQMEQTTGALVDEFTVGRAAGIVKDDLSSQEYVHSPARAQIRRLFDELADGGMIRVSQEGYWRPRTTLAGRRALQHPDATLLPPTIATPIPDFGDRTRGGAQQIPDIFGDEDGDLPPGLTTQQPREEQREPGGWPGWWPAALRFGDPGLTPLIGSAAAALVALLLVVFVATRIVGGLRVTPTPTVSAAAQTATIQAANPPTQPPPVTQARPSAGGSAAGQASASGRPSTPPTATTERPPTATAGPQTGWVRIANTELQGAFLYATPAGERTKLAIPEGILVEIAGPDQRDTQGRNWKHVYWANDAYWLLEEYTAPAEGP